MKIGDCAGTFRGGLYINRVPSRIGALYGLYDGTAAFKIINVAAGRLLAIFDPGIMPNVFPAMLEPFGVEMSFMIPDMFYLELPDTATSIN